MTTGQLVSGSVPPAGCKGIIYSRGRLTTGQFRLILFAVKLLMFVDDETDNTDIAINIIIVIELGVIISLSQGFL